MLRAEGGAKADAGACGERIEAVDEVAGDRGGMGDQRDALAFERGAQRGVGEQAVDTEQGHAAPMSARGSTKQASWWKSGWPGVVGERPVAFVPVPFLDHRGEREARDIGEIGDEMAVRFRDSASPSVAMAIWAGISRLPSRYESKA